MGGVAALHFAPPTGDVCYNVVSLAVGASADALE